MAVRYRKFGKQEYAYKIWNEKNLETKKWVQRSQYLGVVVDKDKGIYEKRNKIKQLARQTEAARQPILDYGDSYLINTIIEPLPIVGALKAVFGDFFNMLMALVFHRITGGLAMRHAQDWYNGNFASHLFDGCDMSSQNISRFLSYLGDENVQMSFFTHYIPLVQNGESGVVIDSTGLPNEINMSVTDWGYHGGNIEFETRLILAINKETQRPLFFRYVAGNIGDVSTLTNTIVEMKQNGINTSSALVDAGYFSRTNLVMLFEAKINFLIRMPSNRVVYKDIIAQNTDIENPIYAVSYNERGLFVKENEIEIYGHTAYAYLVLDPERRGKEVSRAISKTVCAAQDGEVDLQSTDLSNCGKMVLLSSEKLATKDVVPLYYTRQMAERMFGIAKDDLGILPLRTHSEPNFKGFMMLIFIALIIICELKAVLGNKISIEQAVVVLKNLKCKVFDGVVVTNEVTKKQRLLFETCNVLVPKEVGI